MPSVPPDFPWVRAAVFAGITGLLAAGPVNNLVLGNSWHPLLKPWRMYFGFGTELCEVSYEQVAPDGQTRPLDRYALLGFDTWTDAPTEVRNLPDGPSIGHVARRMCQALPGRKPEIRAVARCASIRGWRPAMDREHDLCALGPRQIEGLRPKRRKQR